MRKKWWQYLRIRDSEKTHKVILFESRDFPPKDREFMVFCLKEKVQSNAYPIRRGRKFVDSLTISEKLSYVEWLGRATWNESNQMFDIETTSQSVDNGFVSVRELEDNMRWSVLPESWRWYQPNYKQLVREQRVRRPSFFEKVFKY